MIEPEIAFADLEDVMKLASDMIKFVLRYVMENCPVNGIGRHRPDPEHGAVGIAPGPQVLDGAQVFQGPPI